MSACVVLCMTLGCLVYVYVHALNGALILFSRETRTTKEKNKQTRNMPHKKDHQTLNYLSNYRGGY